MKTWICFIALVFSGAATLHSAEPAPLTLVANGKAVSSLVVGHDAPERAYDAARTLAVHLEWMSGATLPILREPKADPFLVQDGRIRAPKGAAPGVDTFVVVGDCELARKLGVSTEHLGSGGVRIKTTARALVLTGARDDPSTVTYSVFEFLEMLGFRYLWPGELGKVVPHNSTVAVPAMDHSYTPPIGQRNIRYADSRLRDEGLKWLGISKEEAALARALPLGREELVPERERNWFKWQRLGGDLGIKGGHGGYGLDGGWEKWGKIHPEWFALQKDGTRDMSKAKDRWTACISNPGLIEQAAKDIIARKQADPRLRCVSLSPNDGGLASVCMCEACKKLDSLNGPKIQIQIFDKVGEGKREILEYVSLTDRHVTYWNAVAERVAKVHPDLLMSVDAYSYYDAAPVERTLHPNLIVRFVPDDLDKWNGWRPRASRMFWRPNTLENGKREAMLWVYAPKRLVPAFHMFTDSGLLATDFDGCLGHWAVQGINYYACARLNWRPKLTYEEIIDDFCQTGFGPGADAIKRYFLLSEQTWDRSKYTPTDTPRAINLPPELRAQLRGALAEADQAVGENETIRKRVAFLRQGLNWNELYIEIVALARKASAKEPYDLKRADGLMLLACHSLWDMTQSGPVAVNAPSMVGMGANFVPWQPLNWAGFLAAQVEAREAAAKNRQPVPPYGHLTGRENSFREMVQSLGLLRQTAAPAKSSDGAKGKSVMQADDNGWVEEIAVPKP